MNQTPTIEQILKRIENTLEKRKQNNEAAQART